MIMNTNTTSNKITKTAWGLYVYKSFYMLQNVQTKVSKHHVSWSVQQHEYTHTLELYQSTLCRRAYHARYSSMSV